MPELTARQHVSEPRRVLHLVRFELAGQLGRGAQPVAYDGCHDRAHDLDTSGAQARVHRGAGRWGEGAAAEDDGWGQARGPGHHDEAVRFQPPGMWDQHPHAEPGAEADPIRPERREPRHQRARAGEEQGRAQPLPPRQRPASVRGRAFEDAAPGPLRAFPIPDGGRRDAEGEQLAARR